MVQIFNRQTHQYQYFSKIYYTICPRCLEYHGRIFKNSEALPDLPLHPGCECSLVQIERSELKYHRELGESMVNRARQELNRREVFQSAVANLPTNPQTSFELFQEAGHHEFYVDELHEHLTPQAHILQEIDQPHSGKLFKLFLNLNRFHYDKARYGHIPPGMKVARISHGEEIIRSLFSFVEV